MLALNVANMYQWVSQSLAEVVSPAGIAFAVGIVALLCMAYLRRSAHSSVPESWLLQVAAAFAAVIPFMLPAMHDRYFYVAGILAFVCIFIDPRYVVPAALFQFTAVMAYSTAILGQEPVLTYAELAVVQLVAVGTVLWLSLSQPPAQGPDRQWPPSLVTRARPAGDRPTARHSVRRVPAASS
jgi:hypothetical protein